MNTVTITHGTEGPQHDPYSYEEITIKGRAGEVVVHTGLAIWLKRDGRLVTTDEKQVSSEFEKLVGVPTDKLIDSIERHKNRQNIRHIRACRSWPEYVSGFPGEYLTICHKCGEVLDSIFRKGEIE